MKFTAVGDVLVQRHFPGDYEGFPEVKDYIAKGDYRFCNLETTVHKEGECFASQYSGGSYLRIDPEDLNYLKAYGFNSVNCANNHTLDFAHRGVVKTIKYLREAGYEAVGIGENLSRAAAPVYVDTPKGRIALISMATVVKLPASMAGEQNRRVPGRPGVNGLRVETRYTVSGEDLETIRKIASDTKINIRNDVARQEGYLPELPETVAPLGDIMFELGDKPGQKQILNPKDMKRMEQSIFEAKLQADYIFVSIHGHELKARKEDIPDFMQDFARSCIDMGADGIIGHGPHLLRGIEIYKGKPIFYSLGDFILQNENMPFAPEDLYNDYNIPSTETMHKLLEVRSKGFTRGLSADIRMFESVIPYWEMEDGKLTHLELMPILLTFDVPKSRYGMPRINKNAGIIEKLAELSKPFGTKITIKDGVGICEI